jgi:hypothetical protein
LKYYKRNAYAPVEASLEGDDADRDVIVLADLQQMTYLPVHDFRAADGPADGRLIDQEV